MHGMLPDPRLRTTIVTASSRRKSSDPRNRGDMSPGWFALLCWQLWSEKAPAALHHFTGFAERTCRDWAPRPDGVGVAREPPGFVIAHLLRTGEGRAVLGGIMDGSSAEWWLALRRAERLAEVFDAQRKAAQQLELGIG